MEPGRKGERKGERAEQRQERRTAQGWEGEVSSPEECTVCFNVFNESEGRPRTLPCGHTFCSLCIVDLLDGGQLTCPTCRAQHLAPSAAHFPISYVTEALVRKLRETVMTRAGAPENAAKSATKTKEAERGSHQEPLTGNSKRLESLLQEERSRLSIAIKHYQEVQSHLNKYHTQLASWQGQQQQVEDSLLVLLNKNRAAKDFLQQEDSNVRFMKQQGEKEEQELQALQRRLDAPSSPRKAAMAFGAAHRCSVAVEDWMQKCLEMFPNGKTLTTFMKVLKTTQKALDAVRMTLETVTAEVEETPAPASGENSAITLQKIQAPTPPPPAPQEPPVIRVKDLHTMDQCTRSLVEAGRVVAVHQDGGRCRYSKITIHKGRLYLHSPLEQRPPLQAATLQISEVAPASPPCLVFLDLGWPGSPPRRIHIQLSPDSPRGRLFMLLCTGQRGPSYRGSRLWWVGREGRPGEGVAGGEFQSDDERRGIALPPGPSQGHYKRSGKAGSVWGVPDDPQGVQFTITTRDCETAQHYDQVFGEVESGLSVVRAAASHRPITEVTVVDCGAVLWRQ